MVKAGIISKITDIIIEQTVNKKIPTVVFVSEDDFDELTKSVISRLCGSDDVFLNPSMTPWAKVAEIMKELAKIPLIVSESNDIDTIKCAIERFIKELNDEKALVIINSGNVTINDFTTGENISIIIL
jgi:hypothetical protein